MDDHTCVEIAAMAMIGVLSISGLIIDGETGNMMAMAGSGVLGAIGGYVFKAYRNGGSDDGEET